MSNIYHDQNRQLQEQHSTRKLADKMEAVIVHNTLTPDDKSFIEAVDMFFIATADERGHVNCSYKGGDPGFVRVVDEQTIAFPIYDGNGMYLSMGNVLQTEQVGILFIDFERQRRMRFNGTATIRADDPLLADYHEALFIVRVKAREIFPNCPRYIHKMKLVERSRFVPKTECLTPVPSWKKGEMNSALPEDDPAHDPAREVLDS
jgi:predicted pyridoxine 5'-phosphate oxidase superfamily flavin-nucleotide-binding protein